jgi:hypothetical protein
VSGHPPGRARSALASEQAEPAFRFGVVFLLVLALVLFEIVAPAGNWQRAVAFGLASGALLVGVATWRVGTARKRRLLVVLGLLVAVFVVGIATGIVSPAVELAAVAVLLVAIPVTLVRGLLRLVAEQGANRAAIAGALSIYLMIGLLFASVIGFVAEVRSEPYFAQGAGVTNGERVYYSFTVLTTTGFGDFSAATPVGHALAVLEMLSGQFYLVTVIGILIGHYVRRRD